MERAKWTDERLDDRMSAIDTGFERVFEELRAQRVELRGELRAGFVTLNGRVDQLDGRIDQLDDRLRYLDERLSRIGFGAAGILATGLIALVATQL